MNFNCQTTCWDGTLGRDKAIVYRASLRSLSKFNSGVTKQLFIGHLNITIVIIIL